jgi:hypothetical protein
MQKDFNLHFLQHHKHLPNISQLLDLLQNDYKMVVSYILADENIVKNCKLASDKLHSILHNAGLLIFNKTLES